MPARRDPATGRFLPAQPAMPVVEVVEVTPGRRRIRPTHIAAALAFLVLLAALALIVFT